MKHSALFFIFLVVCFALPGVAEEKRNFSKAFLAAAEPYRDARKSDPKVKDLEKWEKAATSLQKFIDRSDSKDESATALFLLGRLHETTYHERKYQAGLSQATFAYEKISSGYAGSELADDALLALGDLRREGVKDEAAARAAYYEIVDRYPSGDKYKLALERLGEAKGADAPSPNSVAATARPMSTPVVAATPVLAQTPAPGEGKQLLSRELPIRRPLIVIDAGHGGEDLGAVGVDGVREKDVVLNIAEFLDELLRDRLRARTVLTRSRDVFIPLPERTKIANENKADLFISIHANASELKTASGVETYYLDNTNDKSSLKLADRENLSLKFGGTSGAANDLGFMLGDLIQNVKLDDSISLAHKLQSSIIDGVGRYYKGVNNLGVKKAPFFVLVGAHMPCVLVEVSFIDHPMEGKRLGDRKYQKMIAQSLYQGVRDYFVPR